MFEFIFKIWFMIAVLPFIALSEGSKAFAGFLKKRNMYMHWDIWHSYLLAAVILLIVLLITGYY
jgi:hypothetical protein